VLGVGVLVVDLEGIIFETGADVEVADSGFELRGQVVVLALEDWAYNHGGHGIMRAGN